MRKPIMRIAAIAAVALMTALPGTGAQAAPRDNTVDAPAAEGTFTFRTANGILPTWQRSNLRLSAVFPGSSITNARMTNATVTLPLVAHLGSTNYAAGGFRITNDVTREYVTCASPAIDTKAGVVDCVLKDGTNLALLSIPTSAMRRTTSDWESTTQTFHGISLRVANKRVADTLNKALSVSVFSPYVNVATGDLTVTFPS